MRCLDDYRSVIEIIINSYELLVDRERQRLESNIRAGRFLRDSLLSIR
jgi:hypothetical protein